jgi:hypothetical protein
VAGPTTNTGRRRQRRTAGQPIDRTRGGYGHAHTVMRDSRCVDAPDTVAIAPDQYREAVDVLASMMLDYHYARYYLVVQPGEQPPTPG